MVVYQSRDNGDATRAAAGRDRQFGGDATTAAAADAVRLPAGLSVQERAHDRLPRNWPPEHQRLSCGPVGRQTVSRYYIFLYRVICVRIFMDTHTDTNHRPFP